MSKSSIGKKKGRSWSLSSSTASSISISPTTTTHTSTLLLTPITSPDHSFDLISDPFAAVSPSVCPPSTGLSPIAPVVPVAPVSATDDTTSPSPPHSPNSTFGRLSSFKRRMARPMQRSYSQSHAHGNYGLGAGATVVRTPLDATAHMQHASISHAPSVVAGRQKCSQYPSRQSSLRSANGSPIGSRRPSVTSTTAPMQRPPRAEPSLEGPALAVEEEKVEIQFMRSPKSQPRKPYQPSQSVDWSSQSHSHSQPHQSLQFPNGQHQSYQQYHQPPSRQSSQQALAQKFHQPKPSVAVSPAPVSGHVPQTHQAHGAQAVQVSLSRSPSSQSSALSSTGHGSTASSAGPQTPDTPRTPEPEDTLDIDIAYHRHRLTSGTGRSSLTITAENAQSSISGHGGPGLSTSLGSSTLGSHHNSSFGSRSQTTQPTQPLQVGSLRTHRSHASLAPAPSPRLAHVPSPSVASFTSIDEDVSPRVPGPMPRRRPSQTSKPDGPFTPIVVGHQIRPSTETSTLVTLRFAFSLDTDPNTHTVTLTLDTLRPAGGRLVQFVEDALRPYSASSASLIGSGESVNSVYSTGAYEGGGEGGPDMTDGSSAESAEDGDSDFEYDPNPSYRFFHHGGDGARIPDPGAAARAPRASLILPDAPPATRRAALALCASARLAQSPAPLAQLGELRALGQFAFLLQQRVERRVRLARVLAAQRHILAHAAEARQHVPLRQRRRDGAHGADPARRERVARHCEQAVFGPVAAAGRQEEEGRGRVLGPNLLALSSHPASPRHLAISGQPDLPDAS
ncbi:hypothetical protein A1Q2_02568 [Trichosporon asahii var. asahii CBS 8904]|uniref:Uncharacterized protein n=1 Tax=Trichosporon asahii var. asahii (strain CBS 8904) TaxID=1220162 RepID=K1WPW9_TRIAC|nr:hypothetical protein A1Q2_02568 [Trichosporon asahii var. asahii CBS 8904]